MTNAHTSKNSQAPGATAGADGLMPKDSNGLTASTQANFDFDGAIIRMIWILGEPWFLAADVCRALQIASSNGSFNSALRKLRNHEKLQVDRAQFFAGQSLNDWPGAGSNSPTVWVISESSLYFLALRCRGATREGTTAFRFRDWVTEEVLPAIRATGSYSAKALPSDALTAKLTEPGREEITFDATKVARYVVTVFPNEPTHIRETPLDAMLDEWSAFDTDILASHIRTVHALWQKTQLMRSIGGDPAGSPLYDRLGATILEGRRLADQYLRHVAIRPD